MQSLAPAAAPRPAYDQRLWQIAKGRARFRSHLLVYVLVNAGLWALYLLVPGSRGHHAELPWPIWTSLFWGFGLASQGLGAYLGLSRGKRTQREYERLLAQQTSF